MSLQSIEATSKNGFLVRELLITEKEKEQHPRNVSEIVAISDCLSRQRRTFD